MKEGRVVYFPRTTVTGVRIGFKRAMAGDEAETEPQTDPLPAILVPAQMLIHFSNLTADFTIRWLGGGVVAIQQDIRFLFVVPRK
jgi:hypothetical protein